MSCIEHPAYSPVRSMAQFSFTYHLSVTSDPLIVAACDLAERID